MHTCFRFPVQSMTYASKAPVRPTANSRHRLRRCTAVLVLQVKTVLLTTRPYHVSHAPMRQTHTHFGEWVLNMLHSNFTHTNTCLLHLASLFSYYNATHPYSSFIFFFAAAAPYCLRFRIAYGASTAKSCSVLGGMREEVSNSTKL